MLVTGSAGRIGTALTAELSDLPLRGADLREGVDLTDPEAARRAVAGCDAVVHLAANPDERASWEALRGPNVDAAVHVLAACAEEGVRRVVFASSVHATGDGRPAGPETPPRPGNLYGVTKAFGETLARHHVEAGHFTAVCLRIGWFRATVAEAAALPEPLRSRSVTGRDLAALVRAALVADVDFEIAYGVSAWEGSPYDIAGTRRRLGDRPRDGAAAT